MNKFKRAIAVLGLAGAITGTTMAGPAFASAPANGSNCHGAYLSYLATSGMAPGQLHHEFGESVKNVQATAAALCVASS